MAKKRSAAAERGAARRARLKAEKAAAKLAGGTGPDAATGAQAGPGEPTKASGAKGAKPAKGDQPFKVRATRPGYYDLVRRREGDVFTVSGKQAFSSRWMERVSPDTPDKITTGQQHLQQAHDEVLAEKMGGKATGDASPLGS